MFFCACTSQFSRTRGWCFRGISTMGDSGFRYHMPAGREGKRAVPFVFALPLFNFHGAGGRQGTVLRWIDTLGGRVFGICMPECWESECTKLCLKCLRRSIFPDRGAVFSGDPYNRRRRLCWIHASGPAGEAHCTVFFCVSTVEFSRSGASRLKELPCIATLDGGTFGVRMPACRGGERTELCFLCLRRSTVQNRGTAL